MSKMMKPTKRQLTEALNELYYNAPLHSLSCDTRDGRPCDCKLGAATKQAGELLWKLGYHYATNAPEQEGENYGNQ